MTCVEEFSNFSFQIYGYNEYKEIKKNCKKYKEFVLKFRSNRFEEKK